MAADYGTSPLDPPDEVGARPALDGLGQALRVGDEGAAPARLQEADDRLDLGAHAARGEVPLGVEPLDLLERDRAERALLRASPYST